jgi:hypothetical protein
VQRWEICWVIGKNKIKLAISGMIGTAIFADAYSIIQKLLGNEAQYAWNFAADYIIQGQQNIESIHWTGG